MPTANISDIDENITSTVMAIREILMEYFKGYCGNRVAHNPDLNVERINGSTQFWYQRHESELAQCRMILLRDVPLMAIRKDPDTVILYKDVLARSEHFSKLRVGIEDFMNKYLPAVTVTEQEGGISENG